MFHQGVLHHSLDNMDFIFFMRPLAQDKQGENGYPNETKTCIKDIKYRDISGHCLLKRISF